MTEIIVMCGGADMIDMIAPKRAVDALVPITRFNRGEANKIFDEVRESGYKVVVKNNTPTCVLIAPERYEKMMEMIIDQYLLELSEERMANCSGVFYSQEELMKEDGITEEDLENIPMEYGEDFE